MNIRVDDIISTYLYYVYMCSIHIYIYIFMYIYIYTHIQKVFQNSMAVANKNQSFFNNNWIVAILGGQSSQLVSG